MWTTKNTQIRLLLYIHPGSTHTTPPKKKTRCPSHSLSHPFREDPSPLASQGAGPLASPVAHRETSRFLLPSWARQGPDREVPGGCCGDPRGGDRPSPGEGGLPSQEDEARPCREEGVRPCL